MSNQGIPVIDIHTHLYPRWYIELLKARDEIPRVSDGADGERFVIFPEEESSDSGGRPITEDYWSLDGKVAFMDRFGIDRAIVSLGNPWMEPFTGADAVDVARRCNADFATFEERTGGRVVGMGVIPAVGIDGICDVVREVATTPSLFGVIAGSRIAGLAFDDPALDPVWQTLQDTGVPFLLHPHQGSAMEDLGGFGHALPVAVAFPFETTIAVTRLVFAGVLHRFPRLRLVASHGAGTIPYLAGRLDAGWNSDESLSARLPSAPSTVLDRLYLDAVLYHPRALLAAADLVGTGHLMFGTDHPFSIADPQANLDAIAEAFSPDQVREVLADSAVSLFGLEMPQTVGPQ